MDDPYGSSRGTHNTRHQTPPAPIPTPPLTPGEAGASRTWLTARCTVQAILGRIAQLITVRVREHARVADLDGDGELTLEDSKLGLSRVAPYVRRHPGLTGGFAGGFILAYRLI